MSFNYESLPILNEEIFSNWLVNNIVAKPDLNEILICFYRDAEKCITALHFATQNNSLVDFKHHCHALKSIALNMNAVRLSKMAKDGENYSHMESASELLNTIKLCYEQTKQKMVDIE